MKVLTPLLMNGPQKNSITVNIFDPKNRPANLIAGMMKHEKDPLMVAPEAQMNTASIMLNIVRP